MKETQFNGYKAGASLKGSGNSKVNVAGAGARGER